ncbi:conserved Plasmodium protein, unknown function [Plasmodium sp. gorilla clade G2]|uniref:conserved Plasmodium protein, unknown function n=1 Tax=Plasmodium sp. gorilla clade G2 TaxID=880535 RepID=UPI000D20F42B|nr:conserved Plasmodium protein, unknown function [Plasmodium sp. gorilla clade G2]SOV11578.1 conserved Plasmodium protein, unknown function [Plasmodium sp. gorilla clade G2]
MDIFLLLHMYHNFFFFYFIFFFFLIPCSFIKKSKDELKNEMNDEIAQYDKHYPYLEEIRKKLVDKLANLKEQYVQAYDSIEKEANNNS